MQGDIWNDSGFKCYMDDGCAAIGEGRKLTVKGQLCAMEDIVVEAAYRCQPVLQGDPEGMVCANEGTASEAYCSYNVGKRACARCKSSTATLSSGGDSLARCTRVRRSTMQLLALMGAASLALSAMN